MERWWEKIFGDQRVYDLLEGGPPAKPDPRQTAFVARAIGLKRGLRVLDCGCGRGWLAQGLARQGARVTGIDSSALMAAHCRRLAAHTPGFTFRRLDFADISFAAEFDAVLCWGNTLGYSTRQADRALLKRLMGALKPGGTILLELHHSSYYRTRFLGNRWKETEREIHLSQITFELRARRLVARETLIPKNGGTPEEYVYHLLHYEPAEIKRLLHSLGAADIRFFGNARPSNDGLPYSPAGFTGRSSVMVVRGVKQSLDRAGPIR